MNLSKIRNIAYVASLAVVITGCAQAVDVEVTLDTDEQKAAYGIGYGFAANLKQQTEGLSLSTEALVKGVSDAMADAEMSISEEDIQTAIAALQQKQMEVQQAAVAEKSAAARAEGEAFLALSQQSLVCSTRLLSVVTAMYAQRLTIRLRFIITAQS